MKAFALALGLGLGLTANAALGAESLPPMMYYSTLNGTELFNALKAKPGLTRLDKESPGSPLFLRVTHSMQPTNGGTAAGLASAMLAGGSLGLLPVVTNNDLVVTYEILVNGTPLTSHAYRENFTQAVNIYTANAGGGLEGAPLTWFLGTAERFAADVAKDPKIAELMAEYRYYFGAEPAMAAMGSAAGAKAKP